jgi:phosphatidylserine/phosphatidylglycerophosphate/cardiolipin synthase-like enzyme
MPIGTRIAKYFVTAGDLEITGEDVPLTAQDCRATYLIDGENYFNAIKDEMDALAASGHANRFFYFADWVLTLVSYSGDATSHGGWPSAFSKNVELSPFEIVDSSGNTTPMLDALANLAANGVDVRALAWVSPFVLKYQKVAEVVNLYDYFAGSVLSIDAIRKKPGLANKAVLNLLAHPVGAIHLKLVICGDDTSARGFTSGMDFEPARLDGQKHPGSGGVGGWHDIAVKVEGPAVDGMYGYFRALWNEQLSRPVERFRIDDVTVASHDDECEEVPDRSFAPVAGGTHRVQVLRTAPQFHLGLGATPALSQASCFDRVLTGFQRPQLSFAPDGIFEFRAALRKAIAAARTYIYVEDQSFTGREIMQWVNQALTNTPGLKVIFVYGFDPRDPYVNRELRNVAINDYLAPGVANVQDRVAFYFRTDKVIVHSKTWIIDDEWAVIGSANAMRRSLYTDAELSVSVLDENEGAGSFAVDFRCDLWAEYCGVLDAATGRVDAAGRARFADLDAALQIWHPSWTAGKPSPGTLRPFLERKRVPFTPGVAPDEFPNLEYPPESDIDVYYARNDGDSRDVY